MTPLRLRALIALVLMVMAFAGAHAWKPTKRLADTRPKLELETSFPRAFGEWQVDERMPVQLISPDQAAILNKIYNQTLSRTYVNRQGARIMLSVAYGGDQSDATRAHRPEVCYPAQGFQVLTSNNDLLAVDGHGALKVRRLLTKLGGRVEPITYWVTVGEEIATSGTEQKLAQLAYGMRGVVPDGLLMRVSSIDPDAQRAYAVQDLFVRDLQRAMAPGLRTLFFGKHGGA
jgi:EpsI family protein